jgi:hypothetical protein
VNWSANRAVTLVCGQSGSGKTTFALRYLVNCKAAVRFVWDADGQLADRLGLPAATTADECEMSLASGWVVFSPSLSGGEHQAPFEWFCGWAWNAAGRVRGRKVLLVDEVWRYCTSHVIPRPLAECVLTGRVRELDAFFCTQHPNRINASLTGETTEAVAFALNLPLQIAPLEAFGHRPDEIRGLKKGEWISRAGPLVARGNLFPDKQGPTGRPRNDSQNAPRKSGEQ